MSKKEQDQAQIDQLKGEYKKVIGKLEDGVIKTNGSEVFDANLPEGLTPKLVRELQNYVTNTVSAAHEVHGEVAINAMAKDKALESVRADIDLGSLGSQTSYYGRKNVGRNPSTQEEVITMGPNRARVDIAGGTSGWRFNAAKQAIKDLAESKLK